MSIDASLVIRDKNNAGVDTNFITMDKNGIADSSNRLALFTREVFVGLVAGSVDTYIWECIEGVWQVMNVRGLISTAGGSGATYDIKVCAGLTAPASGVTQLTAAVVLTTTGPARADGTLIAAPTQIFPGDSLAIDMAGTLTALVACVTVSLKRVS